MELSRESNTTKHWHDVLSGSRNLKNPGTDFCPQNQKYEERFSIRYADSMNWSEDSQLKIWGNISETISNS